MPLVWLIIARKYHKYGSGVDHNDRWRLKSLFESPLPESRITRFEMTVSGPFRRSHMGPCSQCRVRSLNLGFSSSKLSLCGSLISHNLENGSDPEYHTWLSPVLWMLHVCMKECLAYLRRCYIHPDLISLYPPHRYWWMRC